LQHTIGCPDCHAESPQAIRLTWFKTDQRISSNFKAFQSNFKAISKHFKAFQSISKQKNNGVSYDRRLLLPISLNRNLPIAFVHAMLALPLRDSQ
jgi:hypothetical protein